MSREGVEEANKASAALDAIGESVNTIGDMSHQIATAAEEQSAVAEEINATIVRISHAAQATVADASESLGIAARLSEQAQRQEQLVIQFQRRA